MNTSRQVYPYSDLTLHITIFYIAIYLTRVIVYKQSMAHNLFWLQIRRLSLHQISCHIWWQDIQARWEEIFEDRYPRGCKSKDRHYNDQQ